jgi:hypothetical protein
MLGICHPRFSITEEKYLSIYFCRREENEETKKKNSRIAISTNIKNG